MQSSQAKQILIKAAITTALTLSCCCVTSCNKAEDDAAEKEDPELPLDQLAENLAPTVRNAIQKSAAPAKKESEHEAETQDEIEQELEEETQAEGAEENEAPAQQFVVYIPNAAHELFELTNVCRTRADVGELVLDAALCAAAQTRAGEMAAIKRASHVRPDGSSCFSVLDEHGISCNNAGENIAVGYISADGAIDALCNSSDHYQNIVNSDYSKGGVALATAADGTHFWVQLFSD